MTDVIVTASLRKNKWFEQISNEVYKRNLRYIMTANTLPSKINLLYTANCLPEKPLRVPISSTIIGHRSTKKNCALFTRSYLSTYLNCSRNISAKNCISAIHFEKKKHYGKLFKVKILTNTKITGLCCFIK